MYVSKKNEKEKETQKIVMFPHNCLKKKKGECMKKMCIKNMKHESGRCREYNEGVGQLYKSAQSVFKISIF